VSFLNDIISVGTNIYKSISGSAIGSSLAKTAALGFLLSQVNKSLTKENSVPDAANTTQPDRFVREQLSPDSNHSIPVVYGTAYTKGIITDAYLENNNITMWYCVTICEKTGTLLSTGADSQINFLEIYWNRQRLIFQSDGITVASGVDDNGVINNDINGLIKVYCFNNGSVNPVVPVGYTPGTLVSAYGVMPNWDSTKLMSGLVFCLVKLTYNKEKRVTSLGELEFKLANSLTLPGDVMLDYMTNTRYGAGIPAAEIYSA
jgi:hypothetical protein